MSSIMNNYFYGKAGQGDYTVDQMPTTRKQLFFTTLKVRFSSMIGVNFLNFLFMLPALIWLYIALSTASIYYEPDELKGLAGIPQETIDAYNEYLKLDGEYSALVNAESLRAENEEELRGVRYQISRIEAGEEILIEETVVEGGETTTRALTVEELKVKEAALVAAVEKNIADAAQAEDTEYVNDLKAKRDGKLAEYNLYARQALNGNLMTSLMILVPLLMIAAIGRPGMMYVLRNWARDEHSFVWQDYKAAIKDNIGQALGVGLINGLSFLVAFVAFIFYGSMAGSNWVYTIPQYIMVVLLAVWWMANEIVFPMMITYKISFKNLLKNSVVIALARLPVSFAILVGSLVIPVAVLMLVPMPISILVLLILYALIMYALVGFVQASFANSCFDKYLNPRIEGAVVGMGLHKNEDDADEDAASPEQKPDRFWERKTK